MSYLFVVVAGIIAGWVAGQYGKRSESGVVPDLIAGAVGASLAVLFTRMIGIVPSTGFFVNLIVAIIGGAAAVFAARYVMKDTPAPVKARVSRRR